MVLGVVALFIAAQFTAFGSRLTVRSWVRLERLWSRDLPIDAGRPVLRSLEPVLASLSVLRPVRVEVEPGVSLLLDPFDDISRTILVSRTNAWEPEVWSAIERGLPPGGVFMDVGAHIGYDTLKASRRVGPDGRVVAFEPNPPTVALLMANIEASQAGNVIVQPIACSDSETEISLFDSTGGNSGASSLAASNAGAARTEFKVRARPIDAVMPELGLTRLDVFKADVEGAEVLVLRGAANTLRRLRPRLIIEVVPRQLANMGTSVEELEALIWSLGYDKSRQVDYKNREYWSEGKTP